MVVKIDMFCMNGLYNGYVIKIYRVFLLVIFVRNVSVDGNVEFKYSLDFKKGILIMYSINLMLMIEIYIYVFNDWCVIKWIDCIIIGIINLNIIKIIIIIDFKNFNENIFKRYVFGELCWGKCFCDVEDLCLLFYFLIDGDWVFCIELLGGVN